MIDEFGNYYYTAPPMYGGGVYQGLLMDEFEYMPQDNYVPYDESFMMLPEEVEQYRRQLQMNDLMSRGLLGRPMEYAPEMPMPRLISTPRPIMYTGI